MKILWFVNEILPEANQLMNKKPSPFGGWLVYTSQLLSKIEDVKLFIASPNQNQKSIEILKSDSIEYILFSAESETHIHDIVNQVNPDIIHVYGTEKAHSNEAIKYAIKNNIPHVTSIQGLLSILAKHYLSGMPGKIQMKKTFREWIKNDNLVRQQKSFVLRGNKEIETLSITKHAIGRTTWDYACLKQMSNATYHHCNETLRKGFYDAKWDLNKVNRHSLFISQAYYPIKGLHFMLEALNILKDKYPNIKLNISGISIYQNEGINAWLKESTYIRYIKKLIKKFNLENHINFLGVLDESTMIDVYLKTHTFVLPSTIENSPNSLGEAMILGVPSIASYVGGTMDLIEHGMSGFQYQHDAPYMLAHYIDQLWSDDLLALGISKTAITKAKSLYDPIANLNQLINIYKSIINT